MKPFHRAIYLALSLYCLLATPLEAEITARPTLDMNGTWEFRLDPQREGEAGKWFESSVDFPDKIKVPGNWQGQGYRRTDTARPSQLPGHRLVSPQF